MADKRPSVLWERVSRLSLAGVVVLILAAFAVKAAEPYQLGRETSSQVRELRERVRTLQAQNDASEERLASLQTSRGIEIEARKQHFIRPDEVPVRVIFEEAADGKPAAHVTRSGASQRPG